MFCFIATKEKKYNLKEIQWFHSQSQTVVSGSAAFSSPPPSDTKVWTLHAFLKLCIRTVPYTVYSLKVTFHRGYMASHTLFGFFLFRSEQFSGWNWESNILTFRQPEVKFKCLNSQMKKPKSSSVDGSNSASFLLHISVVYHFAPSCMMLFKAFA